MYWIKSKYIILGVLLVFLSIKQGKADDSIQTTRIEAIKLDTLKADTGKVVRIKHSPNRAALLSAVFPGLGQIYNKKYWKLPIIYVAFGISAYYFIDDRNNYQQYLQGFVDLTNNPRDTMKIKNWTLMKSVRPENRLDALGFYMNLYRRWRDWSVFALAGFYILNIIDATVDAYFFDYDISRDLSMKVEPIFFNYFAQSKNGFGVKLCFSLHKNN